MFNPALFNWHNIAAVSLMALLFVWAMNRALRHSGLTQFETNPNETK